MAIQPRGAAGVTVTMDLESARSVTKIFEGLAFAVQKKIASIVAMAGASPILKDAKARVDVDTGTLRDAIGAFRTKGQPGLVTIKVRSRKSFWRVATRGKKAGKSVSIGGRKGVKGATSAGQLKQLAKHRGKTRIVEKNPANYAHIVERGRTAVRPTNKRALSTPEGPRSKAASVGARPFMRPAFDGKKDEAFRKMLTRFDVEVQKEASKLARRHKTRRGRR